MSVLACHECYYITAKLNSCFALHLKISLDSWIRTPTMKKATSTPEVRKHTIRSYKSFVTMVQVL
jgi:hypothetical protein